MSVAGLEPAVAVEVALELVAHLAEEAQEAGVADQGVEPLPAHEAEQAHRVVDGGVPGVGIDPAEQVPGLAVPGPAQVHGQLLERGELRGEGRPDGEAAEAFIAPTLPTRGRLPSGAAACETSRSRTVQTRWGT